MSTTGFCGPTPVPASSDLVTVPADLVPELRESAEMFVVSAGAELDNAVNTEFFEARYATLKERMSVLDALNDVNLDDGVKLDRLSAESLANDAAIEQRDEIGRLLEISHDDRDPADVEFTRIGELASRGRKLLAFANEVGTR